ncbi:MAG TPA: penicillin-binding transpeptidase domain-containing protein, partial [Planctomycetota bacterium]|nr:penicillin-binding transpeptidase domain-containing protein [Planctomycetota bacterium]
MDQIIKSRVGYFLAGLCLIFFSIICRAGYLQIICHERYAEEASDNIYRSRRVSPLRGAIYDRNGVLLARDAPSYNISVRLGELFPDLDYRNKNRNNPPLFLPNLMYIERLCDLLTKHGYKVNQTYTEEILNENGELVEIETVKLELISIEYILERLESRFKNRVAVVSKKIDEKKEEYKKSPRRFNQERRNIEKDWYLRPNILLTNIPQSAAYELYQAEQTLKLDNIATILNESKKQSLTENYYQGFILETSMEREYPEKDLAAQFLGQMRLIREKELSFIKKAKNDLIQNFAQKFNIQMPENTSTHHLLFPAVKSFILHEQKIWQSEVSFTNMNVHDEEYINTNLREYEINTLLQKKESTLQGLSKITNKDLASILEDKSYYENDRVGSFGIESVFEFALRGTYGSRAEGRGNFQFEEPAIDGKNIYLSLDSHLQRISEQALDQAVEKSKSGIGGSVIFIHIPTGEIRVMATSPRYDNNRYRQDYTQLLEDPKNPLTNRCFAYNTPIPPGSTFKIAVALYALQHGF